MFATAVFDPANPLTWIAGGSTFALGAAIAGAFIKGWVVPGHIYDQAVAKNDRYEQLAQDQADYLRVRAHADDEMAELLQMVKADRDEQMLKAKVDAEVERRLHEEHQNVRAHPTRGGA